MGRPPSLFLRFDARRLLVAILFVAVFTMAARAPADTDTWWHLQAGRATWESGHILRSDIFSHTRQGQPWINHSWLSQVLLYLLFHHFGYAGLGLFQALVVTLAFGFVYAQMEGPVFLRALVIILAAAASAVIWIARPQLLSFLLTAVVGYLLHLFKWRRVNRLWLLPPLFVLWVNLHGGYALGFILLAGFLAGEVFNHLLPYPPDADAPRLPWRAIGLVTLVAGLSFLCLVLNPYTTRMWTYYLETVRINVLQDFIQEWQSPNFHPLSAQPFIWLWLATLAAVGLSGRRLDGVDLALVAGLSYSALLAGRNIGPFALVAAPVLSRHAAAALDRWTAAARARGWLGPPRRRRETGVAPRWALVNWLLLTLVVLAAGAKAAVPWSAAFNRAHERETLPVGGIEWIRAHRPPGEMFNSYNWGGYLIWHLWPDYRVFVDGRTFLYGDRLLREYLRVRAAAPGFEDVLDEYGVNLVLVEAGSCTAVALAADEDWTEVYADDIAVIFTRRPPLAAARQPDRR